MFGERAGRQIEFFGVGLITSSSIVSSTVGKPEDEVGVSLMMILSSLAGLGTGFACLVTLTAQGLAGVILVRWEAFEVEGTLFVSGVNSFGRLVEPLSVCPEAVELVGLSFCPSESLDSADEFRGVILAC